MNFERKNMIVKYEILGFRDFFVIYYSNIVNNIRSANEKKEKRRETKLI